MSFALFLLTFAFYLSGLSGTIPSYRDSGDLIVSIHTLGIAHPPGYALYVLVGKLFVTLLPFGNVAYRVNVMSAFFAAASAALLFNVLRFSFRPVRKEKRGDSFDLFERSDRMRIWCASGVVLLFATSPAVVVLARVAEMYTMAAFLAAAILLCLQRDSSQSFCGAALLLGLGLSVHPTLILMAPLFLASPVRPFPRVSLLYFVLGLTVFFYLPIRASQHPLVNWGDPSNWRNFWRVVTRADYGGLKLHPEQSSFSWSAGDILAQLKYFASAMKGEWGWGALGFGCAGIFAGLKQTGSRRLAAGLLGSWMLAGPAFFLLSNLPLREPTTPAILQPYLVLVNLLWALFVGMGITTILAPSSLLLLPQGGEGNSKKNPLAPLWGERVWVRGAIVLAVLVAPAVPRFFPLSQRNDFYAYDYARNLLRSLPPNAVLYEPDDPTRFSIQVLQRVEHRRPDVVLLNFFRTRWGYEQIKREWPDLLPLVPIENAQELQRLLWEYSARRRPFYAELPQKLTPIPYGAEGLVYAARKESSALSRERAEALLGLDVQRGDFVTTHHPDFFTGHLISYYAAAQNNLGIEYANAGDWRRAIAHYQAALRLEPDQSAAQRNLAFALQKKPKLL
jgi:tetratricopeptide (TPR) repeat protein